MNKIKKTVSLNFLCIFRYFRELCRKPNILKDANFQRGIQLPENLRLTVNKIADDIVCYDRKNFKFFLLFADCKNGSDTWNSTR